jgi:hypothetical protein
MDANQTSSDSLCCENPDCKKMRYKNEWILSKFKQQHCELQELKSKQAYVLQMLQEKNNKINELVQLSYNEINKSSSRKRLGNSSENANKRRKSAESRWEIEKVATYYCIPVSWLKSLPISDPVDLILQVRAIFIKKFFKLIVSNLVVAKFWV